jgi:uncharacterized OB-fold protein
MRVPFDATYLSLEPEGILGAKCRDCGIVLYGRQTYCENCGGTNVDPIPLTKTGTVWSYTVQRYPPTEPYKLGSVKREDWVPRVVAWVETPEGPRILSIVESLKPEEAKIGSQVEFFVDKGWTSENGDEVMILKCRPRSG